MIAVVESLPAHLRALALYCFGPESRRDMAEEAEAVQIALYRHLLADGMKLPGQGKGLPTTEQLETLRYLCGAALYHHSEVTWPYQRPGLTTPRAVQGWLDEEKGESIDVRRWHQSGRLSWSDVWYRMLLTLDAWEQQALMSLAVLTQRAA